MEGNVEKRREMRIYLECILQVLYSTVHVYLSTELHGNVALWIFEKGPRFWSAARFCSETFHLVYLYLDQKRNKRDRKYQATSVFSLRIEELCARL